MKRYFHDCDSMGEHPDGDYVRYDDVAAHLAQLAADNARLRDALASFIKRERAVADQLQRAGVQTHQVIGGSLLFLLTRLERDVSAALAAKAAGGVA